MGFFKDTAVTELDNGIRLCCFHRRGSSVELQFHVATGSIHEGEFLGCGLSHFLEHMAFQGCAGYPGRSIADEVNSLGGDVNAYTSYDRTCYRMQLPKRSWRKGVDMLTAMVRYPEFPEERFAAEKEVILRECERGNDDISRRLHEKFLKTMFLKHPVRYPIIGFKEMISKVTRDMMAEYYRRRYCPGRCVVVAVGDISASEFFQAAQAALGDWQISNLQEVVLGDETLPAAVRQSELIYPDPQERIFWGTRIPGGGSPELPALELLFGLLGTGDGSILVRELVLEKSLALGVRSFCYSLGDVSLAGISAKTEPGKMDRFQKALTGTLENVAAGKISAAHLEREKGQLFADRLRELRDSIYIAGEIAGGIFFNNTPDAGDKFLEDLQQTGIDEVKAAAAKYLDQNHWVHIHQHNRKVRGSKKVSSSDDHLSSWKLASGNQIVYAPDHQVPLCNFFMVLRGGALFESSGKAGISRLLAQVLPSGGGKYDESAFIRELDAAGILLDVSAGANSLQIEFSAPKRKMMRAMKIIAEMLKKPGFDAKVIEREKRRVVEMIQERAFNPVKAAGDRAFKLLYGDHPYATSRCGKAEDIETITRDDLAAFYQDCCRGEKIYGFGGDCNAKEAEEFAAVLEKAIPESSAKNILPPLPEFPEKVLSESLTLEREQTVVLRTIPGMESAGSSDDILNVFEILLQAENGLASTLFKRVREEHALSYAVGMTFSAGFQTGAITFYAMTAAGAEKQVMELLNEEISRLGRDGLSRAEFEAARSCAVFENEKISDTAEALIRNAVMDVYYGRSPETTVSRAKDLAAISLEKFNSLIAPYFSSPAGVEIVVVPQKQNGGKN